jgi:DnaK suppressor protein
MAKKRPAPAPRKVKAARKAPSKWLLAQKEKLRRERDELRREIDSETRLLGVMGTSHPREDADIAEEDREDQEVAHTVELRQSRFHQIEDALARIEKATYGRCADCQRPIPRQRLEALPSATRCAACQAAFEKKRKTGNSS